MAVHFMASFLSVINPSLDSFSLFIHRQIFFCCSTKGNTYAPINLPLTSPFYLIAYANKVCQAVRGAISTVEHIFYETEYYTLLTVNSYGGAHPYGVTATKFGHTIYYCYYTRK